MFDEVIYVSMLKVTTVLLIFISMAAGKLVPHYQSEKYPRNEEVDWDYCATEVWVCNDIIHPLQPFACI